MHDIHVRVRVCTCSRAVFIRVSRKLKWNSRLTSHGHTNIRISSYYSKRQWATMRLYCTKEIPPPLRIPPHLEIDSVCYIGITTFHAPRSRPYPGNCREQWRYAGRCGVYPARRESFLIRPPRAFNRDRLLETVLSSPRVRDRWLRILLTSCV